MQRSKETSGLFLMDYFQRETAIRIWINLVPLTTQAKNTKFIFQLIFLQIMSIILA